MSTNQLYKLTILLATFPVFIHGCKKSISIYGFQANCCSVKKEINAETHFVFLSCDKWDVQIDYGFGVYSPYSSHSTEDYLKSEKWKFFAIQKLLIDSTSKVNIDSIIKSIKVLSIDDSLNAKLQYLDQVYEHRIVIPEEISDLKEIKMSNGSISKRLIYNKKTMKTFRYFLMNNDNIRSDGLPESISVYLKSYETLGLDEATKLFEHVEFPARAESSSKNTFKKKHTR
jgi:hypothetical protein